MPDKWQYTLGRSEKRGGDLHVLHVRDVTGQDQGKMEKQMKETADILGWKDIEFMYKDKAP